MSSRLGWPGVHHRGRALRRLRLTGAGAHWRLAVTGAHRGLDLAARARRGGHRLGRAWLGRLGLLRLADTRAVGLGRWRVGVFWIVRDGNRGRLAVVLSDGVRLVAGLAVFWRRRAGGTTGRGLHHCIGDCAVDGHGWRAFACSRSGNVGDWIACRNGARSLGWDDWCGGLTRRLWTRVESVGARDSGDFGPGGVGDKEGGGVDRLFPIVTDRR